MPELNDETSVAHPLSSEEQIYIGDKSNGNQSEATFTSNELGFPLKDVTTKESKLLKEIPPISDSELKEVLQGQEFLDALFAANNLVREQPRNESGFSVIRSLQNQQRFTSDVERGNGIALDSESLKFSSVPPELKDRLNIEAIPGQYSDVESRNTWDTIDVMSVHFHPLEFKPDEDVTGGWFNASSSDYRSLSVDAERNSLKLRVKTGIPSQILRTININDPDLNQTPELSFLRSIKDHYRFLLMAAPSKRLAAQKGSFEAEYRPFMAIAMSLGVNKVQMLVLRDNPQKTATTTPEPQTFAAIPFDLENTVDNQQEIVNYYNAKGYDAQIVFIEKNESGYRVDTNPNIELINLSK